MLHRAPEDPEENIHDLLERAASLERQADWEGADRLYASGFARAVRERRPDAMAGALRRQAEVRRVHRSCEEGEELAWLSLEIAERNGLPLEAARALNQVACTRYAGADFEGARFHFEAALDRGRSVRDGYLVGVACQNLGVLANIRGELMEARSLYLESIAASVRSGDRTTAMLVYHNLGMVCGDLGDWLEAELYFDRGIDLAEREANLPLLARLHVNRAEPLIQLSEFARARESLERASELAERVREPEVAAAVQRFHGVIARLEGNLPLAEAHLERARALAAEGGGDLEFAEATGSLASVRALQGRGEEARALLEEGAAIFRRLGALREVGRLEERLREMGGPADA
jgi:tetratricopeptide (TPR) repeat protein